MHLDSPCIAEANWLLRSPNLTSPCMNTPQERFSVTNTDTMPSQELNTLNCPYSAVLSSRVKMGVVMATMPFCRK